MMKHINTKRNVLENITKDFKKNVQKNSENVKLCVLMSNIWNE